MEFKLNKIDTELRQKINDATREGKVHGKESVYISKDKKENKKDHTKGKTIIAKKGNSNKLLVDAEIKESVNIDGYMDDKDKTILKGTILDIRK